MVSLTDTNSLMVNLNKNVLHDILTNDQESKYKDLDWFDFMIYMIIRTNERLCENYSKTMNYFSFDKGIMLTEIRYAEASWSQIYHLLYDSKRLNPDIQKAKKNQIKNSIFRLLDSGLIYCYFDGYDSKSAVIEFKKIIEAETTEKWDIWRTQVKLIALLDKNYIKIPTEQINKLLYFMRKEKGYRDKAYYFMLLCCVYEKFNINRDAPQCYMYANTAKYFTMSPSNERRSKWTRADDILNHLGICHLNDRVSVKTNSCGSEFVNISTVQYFGFSGEENLKTYIKYHKNLIENSTNNDIVKEINDAINYEENEMPMETKMELAKPDNSLSEKEKKSERARQSTVKRQDYVGAFE